MWLCDRLIFNHPLQLHQPFYFPCVSVSTRMLTLLRSRTPTAARLATAARVPLQRGHLAVSASSHGASQTSLVRCTCAAIPVRPRLVAAASASFHSSVPRAVQLGGGPSANEQGAQGEYINPNNVPAGASLRKYCIDLTQMARDGKLDPVIGRDPEMRRTIEILSRRTKNNPVLLGEPGVGM